VGSLTWIYLDRKTQLILQLAGVWGAVSFTLVENIPVWDNVTKTGSKYKAELKAMTSSSIVFTLFVFRALTYLAVKHGIDSGLDGPVAGSNLTHRLLSEPLDSDDEGQTQAELVSTPESLEIEHHGMGARQHTFNHAGSHVSSRGPHDETQYHHSNEWISS
jgi:hypothetical protein